MEMISLPRLRANRSIPRPVPASARVERGKAGAGAHARKLGGGAGRGHSEAPNAGRRFAFQFGSRRIRSRRGRSLLRGAYLLKQKRVVFRYGRVYAAPGNRRRLTKEHGKITVIAHQRRPLAPIKRYATANKHFTISGLYCENNSVGNTRTFVSQLQTSQSVSTS